MNNPENNELYLRYTGVCAMLGRLAKYEKDEDQRYFIELAMKDCISLFPDRFILRETTDGGFSLEPKL